MPLPIAHGLIGASIIAASRPNISLRQHWKALSLGAALAVAPDCDFFFEWVLNLDGVWHRGFSHSIMFSVACGLLASVLSGGFRPKEAAAYGAATLSHCLLDLVTTRKHLGVELFWPFSSARIDLDLFDYSQFNFDPRQHPVS
ncbi:MAG: metal-dependent hydrolase, partial [Pyrinomonadaceae bacterium]